MSSHAVRSPRCSRAVAAGRRFSCPLAGVLVLAVAGCGGDPVGAPQPPPPGGPWSTGASMPAPRAAMGAALFRGQIYVVGGTRNGTTPLATVFRYDPPSDSWTQLNDLPEPRLNPFVVVLGDTLYAMAGDRDGLSTSTLWAYLPDDDEWVERAMLPLALDDGGAAGIGGQVFVAGGVQSFPAGLLVDSISIYSQADDAWRRGPVIPTARRSLAVVAADGLLYALGGQVILQNSSFPLSVAEVFDPATETWSSIASLPQPRFSTAAAVGGGRIRILGGGGLGAEVATRTHQVYDIASGQWSLDTEMPRGRVNAGAVALPDGRVFVMGGLAETGQLQVAFTASVEVFTP